MLADTDQALNKLDNLRQIGPFQPIQVVPTFEDHELLTEGADPNAPVGVLTNHGGRTITSAKVATIYLDTFDGDKAVYDAFVKAIVEDGYYVSPDGSDTSDGTFLGSFSISSGLSGTVDASQIASLLLAHFGVDIPHADPNTLFNVVCPVNMVVKLSGASSCNDFCGYHSNVNGTYYAVIVNPDCGGCTGNLSKDAAREMITGHEYGEWRSDPDGTAWYSDTNGMENGDECAWEPNPWGPNGEYTVQPLAVNGRGCFVSPYKAPATPTPQPSPEPQPQPQPSPQPSPAPSPSPAPPPPAHAWPKAGDVLSPYLAGIMQDPTLLDSTKPAGSLLAYVLAHPDRFVAGQPDAMFLEYVQANPGNVLGALTTSNGQGGTWETFFDNEQAG